MKKIFALLLIATLAFALFACTVEPVTCEHGDENYDGKCDICGETVGSCTHSDANGDNTCDKCGADVTPPAIDWNSYETITFEQAATIAASASGETTERYYIRAFITSVTNPTYGAMTIKDATGNTLSVYNSKNADGTVGYAEMTEKPHADDEVLLYCTLGMYKESAEIKNAWIIDYKVAAVDITDYTDKTIAEARAAEVGTKVAIEGVVARITYANGKMPSGVILVDGTSSIYVYDGDIAGRVAIGNKIKVAGSKTYWILGDEMNNAEKFGYKGCNQLENATLVSNDEGNNDFDKSWITETTMMDLLGTPVTEDITSLVYKVTALVKKVPGNGFTNYYFFDLDGKTGTYTYTQCNGSDFTWLDEFDGKICTVYITALNAKSTATDCYFRVLPVDVAYENFTFNLNDTAEHVLKYYAIPQFLPSYSGDPALSLITSVSSELLGFENATITYTSFNEDVVKFEVVDGETIMHCVGAGTATIDIKATYNSKNVADEITITVTENQDYEYVSVKDAIDAEVNDVVIVKGIVGPSVVNQSAFYLIDATGAIAIKGDSTMFEGLEIGHEVIIEGTRTVTKDGGGQICLENGKILANSYGEHAYSTESFITGKTVADIKGLTDSVEETSKVYVITGTIKLVDGAYSDNYYVTDGTNDLLLYAGGGSQYSWLADFIGQEITIEYAVCDWNAKGLKGCVLSIITADGTQIFNEYNFKG